MKEFFAPQTIAVIGASSDPTKVGGMITRNIIASGFKGKLYPVNLKPGEIEGVPFIRSVDLVESVDLAIIVVPARFVVDEMKKLASIGTKNVIVITAGFKEEGKEGRLAEQQVHEIAKKNKMRVIGPNCFGVIDTQNNMNATFSSLLPPRGNVALGSQSGAVGATMLDWSRESCVGISKFVSLGNKMDVKESDLIRTFDRDKETKVIGIYTEGISDGEEFMRSVHEMKNKKPIIVLKSGRTSAGSRAASSHTGALAGSDSVYDAVFKKLNIIRAKDIDEMFDLFSVFSMSEKMENDGIAVITNAGGLGVMAADACSDSGSVKLAELSLETMDRIVKEIPSTASELNPIDLRGDAKNSDIEKALRIVSEDPEVGAALLLASPLDMIDLNAIAERLCEIRNEIRIPIAVSFAGGDVADEASDILRKGGIPTFPTPDRAVLALSSLRAYSLNSVADELVKLPDISGRKDVLKFIREIKKEGRSSLSEEEGKRILRAYGIPVPPESRASDVTEATDIAGTIGYPVVMKILSPDIHHKTDVGGVVVGIKDESSLRIAYESMIARCRMAVPDAKIDGVSIQKMVSGQEVIVSMIRDDQFGPVLSFGLGGIYVEILKEISQTVLPVSKKEFERIITSTKAYRLLSGARGKPPADIDSLKDIILKLAKIAEDNPEIYELEINPVMVNERSKGSWAVDALVTLR
jgi:Acyl-CoA synthetase (NDP forming)